MTPKQTRRLMRSSVIVIAFLSLEKVGGLVRGVVMAGIFGAGAEADAFSAANQLPELLYAMLAGGALSAAYIPVYSGYLTRGQDEKRAHLYQTVMTLLIVVLGGFCLVGAVIAPWLVRVVLVPDFAPAVQVLTAQYMRLVLLSFTMQGISVLVGNTLNAHQHFASSALAPAGQDVGRIVGLLAFVPRIGAIGAGWGAVLGTGLHFLVQIPAAIYYKLRFRPRLNLRLDGVREVLWLMLPRILTMGLVQAVDLVIIRQASSFPAGNVSAYFYAQLIVFMPISFFGWSLAGVVFPTMAERFNAGDIVGLKRVAMRMLGAIWFLCLPSAVGLVLLGRQLVALVLQRGAFDEAATTLVYAIIVMMSARIVIEPTVDMFGRLFYAQHNTLLPMVAQCGWAIMAITLIGLFIRPLGVQGVALAGTIASALLAVLLYALNRRQLGALYEHEWLSVAWRSGVSTAGMAVVVIWVKQTVSNPWLTVGVAIPAAVITYITLFLLIGGHKLLKTMWQSAN